jgi:hypothetical protein
MACQTRETENCRETQEDITESITGAMFVEKTEMKKKRGARVLFNGMNEQVKHIVVSKNKPR